MKKELFIVHGWAYSVEPWDKVIENLKNAGLKVKMLNVPGLTAPSSEIWDIEKYVDWANKSIPTGATVLGHSNGGRILMNLCVKKPKKIGHLILLDSAGVYEKSFKRGILKFFAVLLKPLKKINFLNKLFHKLTGSTDYYNAPENMKKTMTNLLKSDKFLEPEKILTKTTILWGEKDKSTPLRQAKILNEKIQGSTCKTFTGWGHVPYKTHPDELTKEILKLMKD